MTLKTNHQETLCQVNLVFRDRLHLTPCRKARVSVRITERRRIWELTLYIITSLHLLLSAGTVLLILAVKTPVQPGPEFLVCRISALAITQGSYYTCRRSNRNCLRFRLSGSEALTAIIRNNRAPTKSEAEKLNTDMHVPLCGLREATGATMILCSGPAIIHMIE